MEVKRKEELLDGCFAFGKELRHELDKRNYYPVPAMLRINELLIRQQFDRMLEEIMILVSRCGIMVPKCFMDCCQNEELVISACQFFLAGMTYTNKKKTE